MSNIQTGAERMPHDLSHLGFLAGQIGRLITISTTPDRKSGSAGMPRPISYAVFCLKKKTVRRPVASRFLFRPHAAQRSASGRTGRGGRAAGRLDTPGVTAD